MRRFAFVYFAFYCVVAMYFVLISIPCHAHEYGLRVIGHSCVNEDNTTLILSPDGALKCSGDTEVRFSMSLGHEAAFGNIMSIAFDNGSTLYCIVPPHGGLKYLALKYGNTVIKHPQPVEYDVPMDIAVAMHGRDSVGLSIDGNNITVPFPGITGKSMSISFGRPLGRYENHEVVTSELWDIEVLYGGDVKYRWNLREHNDSICYDELAAVKSVAINGEWLLDNHVIMKRIFHLHEKGEWQITYNQHDDEFLITDGHRMIHYVLEDDEVEIDSIAGGHRAMKYSNALLCMPATGEIYSYDLARTVISGYDKNHRMFGMNDRNNEFSAYHNHTLSISGDRAYAFGGYGFYRYHNDLFEINVDSNSIVPKKYYPPIPPRNSAASCIVDGKMYVFGGFGNESGLQELDCHYCYDMYCIDLSTMRSEMLWNAAAPENDFIVTSEMIWSDIDSCFYVGTTSPDGAIAKVYRDRPEWEFVVQPTDCVFNYRDFTFNLYSSDALQRMFLVIDKHLDDDLHDISIYSVDLPLMPTAVSLQAVVEKSYRGIVIWAIVAALSLFVLILSYRRWRSRLQHAQMDDSDNERADEPTAGPTHGIGQEAYKVNCINLLGKFAVIDRGGNDITGSFTGLLRNLLVVLILHSVGKRSGISKEYLDSLLWGGMDMKKAQANRQVNLSRLRVLLRSIDGIEIEKDSISFRLEIDEGCQIDYLCVVNASAAMRNYDDASLVHYLGLPLLPEISAEWLDEFKRQYSDIAISKLEEICRNSIRSADYSKAEAAATALLVHDPFSDSALRMLCHSLFCQKRFRVARTVYDRFCCRYSESFGEPFGTPFADLYK